MAATEYLDYKDPYGATFAARILRTRLRDWTTMRTLAYLEAVLEHVVFVMEMA